MKTHTNQKLKRTGLLLISFLFVSITYNTVFAKCSNVPCEKPPSNLRYGDDIDGPYINNGNGTVTDQGTGLMWQQDDGGNRYTWVEACQYCEELTLGGYSDWELPDIYQFLTIYDSDYSVRINTNYFNVIEHEEDNPLGRIWTGSTCYFGDDPSASAMVKANACTGKNGRLSALCVRPGVPVTFSISAWKTSGEVPLAVSFTSTIESGIYPFSYSWVLGDGSTSTSSSPAHTYTKAGNFTATLTITDAFDQSSSQSVEISVNEPETYSMNKSVLPSGSGIVQVSPDKTSYDSGATVTLTATPNSCYNFTGWSGDTSGANTSTTLTMNSNKSVTANFSLKTYSLNTSTSNGSINRNPDKISYSCGETVTLTVIPDSGYKFTGWSGDASGTNPSTTINMNSDKTVTANFSQKTYNLNITAEHGTVTVNPSNSSYDCDSSVMVTAEPETGYKFVQWSGDASGTNSSITITIKSDTSITAEFAEDISPITVTSNTVSIIENETENVNFSGGTGFYQVTSDDTSIAEASLDNNTVHITAISEGSTVVTINDRDNNTVTIEVVVSKHEEEPSSGIGKAIVIAGGGAHQQNTLFKYSDELSKQMYRLLNQRGYSKSDIIYMNPHDWQDINGDGVDDKIVDYQLFDPQNELEEAFTLASQGLSEGNQFVFYIHGHARPDSLSITRDYKLPASQLKTLLDKIPSGIQQIVIIDSCYSGSFLDELSGNANRIVMTSSDDHTLAWNVKYTNFSSKLIRTLKTGRNLLESFQAAEDMMKGDPGLFGEQSPQLDDDGDGYHSTADGSRSARINIGKEGVHAAEPPIITLVHPRIELPEGQVTETIWVKVSLSNEEMKTVRAILIKPGFKPTEYQGEDTLFKREELELIYNAAKERYEIDYVNFRDAGVWRIMYQAQGIDGEWSESAFGVVNAGGIEGSGIIRVEFNQLTYQTGEQLRLDIIVNGNEIIDLYVALFFPQGFFQTITYPLNFNMVNAIMPYKTNIELSGEKTFPIMNFVLPPGIPTGVYTCYGLATIPASDPWQGENWIHFDFKTFEIK